MQAWLIQVHEVVVALGNWLGWRQGTLRISLMKKKSDVVV